MITLLEKVLDRADGTYISAQDLHLLDTTLSSWNRRKETYAAVQRQEGEIIRQALELMQDSDRFASKPINQLGIDRCQRDMTLGLRCSAMAMLYQDEELFKDRILYWQQNIFDAMNLNYQGYKFLWQSMRSLLAEEQAELMKPYLRLAHELMSGESTN